ncbi:hypothetical protein [Brevundimonas sp.]
MRSSLVWFSPVRDPTRLRRGRLDIEVMEWRVKVFVVLGLAALSLCGVSTARAQDAVATRVLAKVCLPYTTRSTSLEEAVEAARELDFRRPNANARPLDPWASEAEMVSWDGSFRLVLSEGQVDDDYSLDCVLSSRRASVGAFALTIDELLGNRRGWAPSDPQRRLWKRATQHADDPVISAVAGQGDDGRPALSVNGTYPPFNE